MRTIMTIALGAFLLTNWSFKDSDISEECKLTNFEQLRILQKQEINDKERLILKLGYKFLEEDKRGDIHLRHFGKCNKPYGYYERIILDVAGNSITYSTFSREQYQTIKKIVGRMASCEKGVDEEFEYFESCPDGMDYYFSEMMISGAGVYLVDISDTFIPPTKTIILGQ